MSGPGAGPALAQHDIAIEPYEDMELTDWDALDAFARDFVARARRRTQERSPGSTTSTGQGTV